MKVKKLMKKIEGTIPDGLVKIKGSADDNCGVYVTWVVNKLFGERKVKSIRAKNYLDKPIPIIEITIKGRFYDK